MEDKEKVNVTDTLVPDFHLTSKNRLLVEEITEGTTMQHRYQPEVVRVSLARRLLNRFMSRFWQSDLR